MQPIAKQYLFSVTKYVLMKQTVFYYARVVKFLRD